MTTDRWKEDWKNSGKTLHDYLMSDTNSLPPLEYSHWCEGCGCSNSTCKEYRENGAIACCPDCNHEILVTNSSIRARENIVTKRLKLAFLKQNWNLIIELIEQLERTDR